MVTLTLGVRVTWLMGRHRKGTAWAACTLAPAPALGKLFGHGVLVQAHPRLLREDRSLTGRPRRNLGHRDNAVIRIVWPSAWMFAYPGGQVGMIMAGFVPISGYERSKNQSGRPDLIPYGSCPVKRSGHAFWDVVSLWLLGMLAGPLAVASGLRQRWVRWWG